MPSTIGRILRSPFAGLKAAAQSMFPRGGWGLFSIPRSSFNYEQSVGDGLGSSVFVAPVKWMQRNFVEAPVRLRKRSGDELTAVSAEHPFLSFVRQPNDAYSGTTLLKASIASWEVDGNVYWLCALNNQGRPVQAWFVPHTLAEPHREEGSQNFIDYYNYQPGDGTTKKIAPIGTDRSNMPGIEPFWVMLHFQDGIDPNNTMKGISGFRSLLREIFTDDEAAQFTASLLKNMGVPGLVISPSDDGGALAPIGEDDVKETKAKVKAATTGDARGEPIIMTGPTKIDTIGFNPQQLNLRDLRKIPEERVTAVIGIPAIVCGLGAGLDRSTFANVAEAKDMAYDDKVLPTQRDFAETLSLKLLPQFETNPSMFEVDFDVTNVRALRDDEDKMSSRVTGLVNGGIISVAEGREKLGEPVRDEHKVYRVPMNLIEVPEGQTMDEALEATVVEPASTPAAPKEGRTISSRNAAALSAAMVAIQDLLNAAGYEQAEDGVLRLRDRDNGKAVKGALNSRTRQRLMIALDREARVLEKQFAKRLTKRFQELGANAAKIWADIAPPLPADISEPKATDDERAEQARRDARAELAALQLAAAEKLFKEMNIDKWQSSVLAKDYAAHYSSVATSTFNTLDRNIGLTLNAPDSVAEQIIRTGGHRVGLVNLESQTRAAIYSALADGKAQGLGAPQLERLIRGYVEAGGRGRSVSARAMRIARTETMNASRLSTLTAYQESGVYSTVIAYDNRIGYDDEDCMERDGQEFTFADAEDEMATEHPNGTLSFAPGEVTS